MKPPATSPPLPAEGRALPALARASVAARLRGDPAPPPRHAAGFLAEPHPVFVTIRESNGTLRGCIGTLTARRPQVAEETWHLARDAAFTDRRFRAVAPEELDLLRFEVSVLHPLEEVADESALDPRRYGVVVSTPDGRRGALLPDIEGIDTVSQQLDIARRKAGIRPGEPTRLQRFVADHYVETPPVQDASASAPSL